MGGLISKRNNKNVFKMSKLIRMRKRKYFFYCIFSFVVSFYLTLFFYKSTKYCNLKDIYKLYCYDSVLDDKLPSAEDPNFSPGDKSIFFLETSCSGVLNSRQACAVESAARLHPSWQINLLFTAPIMESMLQTRNIAKLREFKNVKLARIHFEQYSEGSVDLLLWQSLKKSPYAIEHAADVLRIMTLHKFGGVYLDMNVIIAQSLDSLPDNWVARESYYTISNGVMAFTKNGVGANWTRDILMEIANTYNPLKWSYNGPQAIERVMARVCPGKVGMITNKTGDCSGVKIMPFQLFYPVFLSVGHKYFNSTIDSHFEIRPYMYHIYNHVSWEWKIKNSSLFSTLAKLYCPSIYYMYGKNFGYD